MVPRKVLAETLGVSDKTVSRMNLATVYIGLVAHVKEKASLQDIADKARRRNQPQKPRRSAA